EIELRIKCEIFGEVSGEQFMVFGSENFERERIAAFFDRMNHSLEFGEHRLAKQGGTDIVELAVNDVSAHSQIGRLLQKIMGEQLLVKRGGDLGQENRVLMILISLRFLRE